MTTSLLAAGVVVFALAAIHSVVGEIMLLRRIDSLAGFPGLLGSDALAKQTIRATWHSPSILGAGLGVIVCHYARAPALDEDGRLVIEVIAISLLVCAVLVAIGTRGRHPGWVAFLVAGVLCWVGVG